MGLITLIAGPPCAGKSTLVNQFAEPGDVILDFDRIAIQLGSPRAWLHPPEFVAAVEAHIADQLRALRARDDAPTAWLIRAAPRARVRERLAAALGARVWVLDPGAPECLRRSYRRPNPYATGMEIRKWYRMFTPSPVDESPPSTPTATTSSEVSS